MPSFIDNFLVAVLGLPGKTAINTTLKNRPELIGALVPRTVMSWLEIAAQEGYDDFVPGTSKKIQLNKSETGYFGKLDTYEFQAIDVHKLSAIFLGFLEYLPEEFLLTDIDKLGKSLDLLIKANYVVKSKQIFKEEESQTKKLNNMVIRISKNMTQCPCKECGLKLFEKDQFVGCNCYNKLAKNSTTTVKLDYLEVKFSQVVQSDVVSMVRKINS